MKTLCKLLLFIALLSIANSKLIQVVQIFRHGARYPLSDAYDGESQLINWGELLPSGMRQHYNLGRQLRKEYIEDLELLSPTFNHTEFYIRSTDVNRTIMSAQSQIMGMFPNGPQLPLNINDKYLLPPYHGTKNFVAGMEALPQFFQPIPIHIEPKDYKVLEPQCTQSQDLKDLDFQETRAMITDFDIITKDIRETLCGYFNVTLNDCVSTVTIYNLYGVYISDVFQGRVVPQLTETELYHFELISSFKFYYDDAGSHYSKFFSQPFFKDVFGHLSSKIANPNSALKWVSYSAHDSNVISYARTLNFSSAECIYQSMKLNNSVYSGVPCQMQPQYATNIIFELYNENENYQIKVKYNGVYQKICGNTWNCPYSQFKTLVEGSLATQAEYNATCSNDQSDELQQTFLQTKQVNTNSSSDINFIILSLIIVIITLLAYIFVSKKNQKSNQQQNEIPNDTGSPIVY